MQGFETGHEDLAVLARLDLPGIGTLEEQLDRFLQIGSRRLDRRSLTGYVQLRAEGHVEITLFLQNRGEAAFRHANPPKP
jgi:hypothetical protein